MAAISILMSKLVGGKYARFLASVNSYERQRAAGSFSRHAVGQQ